MSDIEKVEMGVGNLKQNVHTILKQVYLIYSKWYVAVISGNSSESNCSYRKPGLNCASNLKNAMLSLV